MNKTTNTSSDKKNTTDETQDHNTNKQKRTFKSIQYFLVGQGVVSLIFVQCPSAWC